jgi:hypothetical protein
MFDYAKTMLEHSLEEIFADLQHKRMLEYLRFKQEHTKTTDTIILEILNTVNI